MRCRGGLSAAETDKCRMNVRNLTLLGVIENVTSRDAASDIALHVNS